jgi:hypothetical protein
MSGVARLRDDPGVAGEEFSTRGGVAYVDVQTTWGSGFRSRKNATWPFAGLRIGDELIVISSLFGRFLVTRTNLVSISRFRRVPILADGLKFVTNDQDDALIFWTMSVNKVLSELQRRGWKVGNGK